MYIDMYEIEKIKNSLITCQNTAYDNIISENTTHDDKIILINLCEALNKELEGIEL